jgi:non-canonical (house-cleaning) NTP pyrophosphatase
MLFALATKNTPKTNALREALEQCPYVAWEEIQILGFQVASWVPDMPLTLSDIRTGAKNRVWEIRRLCPEANFFVGMEAGIYEDSVGDESWLMGAVYIEDKTGEWHFGYTCHIPAPKAVIRGLHDGSGREMDQIMESLWAPPDTSHSSGSFGMWTDMMLSRSDQFRLAVQCAIAPFFNKFYTI